MSPPVERRLAAILAADVVGYSKFIEADEAGTLAALRDLRQKVLEPLLTEHRGRVVKLMGDGIIAEFGSVVSAVACAAAIQVQLAKTQEAVAPERRIVLRIGVHLGDMVVDGEDLMGDGVNVAARLEQLCSPGGVLISSATYEQLPGKLDLSFEDAGEQSLKNIARPVRAFRLATAGATLQAVRAVHTGEKPAVAVMPFRNMSGDPGQDYFSDGITEDVITELSRFRELMVIARASSSALQGKSLDVREIGRTLGAEYVVEGSVRRAGERVRITAQLVDATRGAELWAERYDRAMEDVFAVQEEIARGIVVTVAQRIQENVEAVARRRRPEDIRAYDLFLQGYRISDVFTPESLDQARVLFEKSRQIDPTFARAYTGLAYIHVNRAIYEGVGVPRAQDQNRIAALRLAEEALALDPNDARVQSAIGHIAVTWRDFDRGDKHLTLARNLNPNDPFIQILWAWTQSCLGRPQDGLPAAELAKRLNPRFPGWYDGFLSRILFQLRRYAEAADMLRQWMGAAPERHPRETALLAAAYGHLGLRDEADRYAGIFLHSVKEVWRGDPSAGPAEYVSWVVDVSLLRRREDEEHLRSGLRLAGLPA
jgi:TolB-like protein